MDKKYMNIALTIFLIIALAMNASAASSDELLNVIEDYYHAYAQEDMDAYISNQYIWHLTDEDLKQKKEAVQNFWDSIDTLSYKIDRFEVAGLDGDTATVTFVIDAKLGEVIEGKPSLYDYKESYTAILTTDEGEWKVFQVMPTAFFDFSMGMNTLMNPVISSIDAEPEPSLWGRMKGFVKMMPRLIRRKPSTCGNLVCNEGEDKDNCAEDCRKIEFIAECGDGVCSDEENSDNCIYDCEESIELPTESLPTADDLENVTQEPPEETDEEPEVSEPETLEPEPLSGCGDGICGEDEDCETCGVDCGCLSNETCFSGTCYAPKCWANIDCDDHKGCTKDYCDDPGLAWAKCSYRDTDECDDGDGCCPEGCTIDTDDDCTDDSAGGSDGSSDGDSSWTTGTETLPTELNGDHAFFQFSTGDLTSDFDLGDIFFNPWGDLMGECVNQGASCAEIKEETSLSFNNMIDPPTSGYDPDAQPSVGDKYWIKTNDGSYGKIEVTAMDEQSGTYESISFKWGYMG